MLIGRSAAGQLVAGLVDGGADGGSSTGASLVTVSAAAARSTSTSVHAGDCGDLLGDGARRSGRRSCR